MRVLLVLMVLSEEAEDPDSRDGLLLLGEGKGVVGTLPPEDKGVEAD